MILIQMTGLSGAGKSTLAQAAKTQLQQFGYAVEIIDGDEYRRELCADLGFSKADRMENIRRLGFVGLTLAKQGVITLLAAINPYEEARQRLQSKNDFVKTVFIDCPLAVVRQRDTKGLYQRAYLPPTDSRYVANFTGVSDPFEPPTQPDLHLHTHLGTVEQTTKRFVDFILSQLKPEVLSNIPPKALFIGRWQPFHNGHKWLIDNKLQKKIPVLIAVRDLPCDTQNPFTTEQTIAMIRKVYEGQSVEVMRISDIESVNYGRGVGYKVQMFEPSAQIYGISATAIRQAVVEGRDDWKNWVDPLIHNWIWNAFTNP